MACEIQAKDGYSQEDENLEYLLLTKSSAPILGQIAIILGWLMDGIYIVLDKVGIQNIGLCIIIFSVIVYALMTPLQIKQQKFSKMSAIMQPELQKIQKKYQGKKGDQEAMMRQQEETQAVYEKYGVSPTGSCVQLLVQMPILLSLYQVIYRIPGYVGSVKEVMTGAMNQILGVNGYTDLIQTFITDHNLARVKLILDEAGNASGDSVIDFLYALSPSQWQELSEMKQFSGCADVINATAEKLSHMQSFFGLNIADQPLTIIKTSVASGAFLLAFVALLIPFLSWLTQVINIKMMPQATGGDDGSAMASSMKSMNTVMPLMSAFFCFTFPVGLGIYWIASAVVRSVQMFVINKKLEKEDLNEMIRVNQEKMAKKREKRMAKDGLSSQKINTQARQSVKNIERKEKGSSGADLSERAKKVEEAYRKAGSGSGKISSKVNMVKEFEERSKNKK